MAKKKKSLSIPSWYSTTFWIIPALAFLLYVPTLWYGFTLDDVLIIEENPLLRSLDNLPELWTSHYWSGKADANDTGLFRPLTLTTYAFQYAIHQDNPMGYHLVNILLHAVMTLVLLQWISLLFRDWRLTLLAGFWFAIHPVHTEAICGIVGRAEILSGLFIGIAGISYQYWRQKGKIIWLIALLAVTACAITSKEHGFMLLFILLLQEFINMRKNQSTSSKPALIPISGVALVSILLWWWHQSITGPAVSHEQWLHVSMSDRMATSLITIAEYIALLILPLTLSADYWTDTVRISTLANPAALASLLLLLTWLVAAVWLSKKMHALAWGSIFFLITLAPVSNFFFAAGFLKAERVLYIPSIGFIVALTAVLLHNITYKRLKIPVMLVISGLSIFYIYKTLDRMPDWKNNYTLAQATLKVSPASPRFNNMMGLELSRQADKAEAISFYQKAVEANPNHVPALVNLANAYRDEGDFQKAAGILEQALVIDPGTLATYVNLMSVYRSMEDYDKNLIVAQKAVERFPQSAAVLWNAANAYQLNNQMELANELRAKARQIDPAIGK